MIWRVFVRRAALGGGATVVPPLLLFDIKMYTLSIYLYFSGAR